MEGSGAGAAPRAAAGLAWLGPLGLVALVGAVLGVLVATGGWSALRPSGIRELAARAEGWGPAAFIGLYSVASFAFVPRGVMALGAGLAWGWPSAAYTYVGALIGESLAFGAARGLGRGFVVRLLGERVRRWDALLGTAGFRTVLVLRLLPLVPCDVINYGAGLGAVRYRDFIGATALGIVPGCLLYALAGSGLVDANPVALVFGFGGLALLALAPFILRSRVQRPASSSQSLDVGVEPPAAGAEALPRAGGGAAGPTLNAQR